MKIWYQTYAALGVDPKWDDYDTNLRSYVQKVARPDTQVDVHGVEKYFTKMTISEYVQSMHVAQVIDKALQAEREGYDAFCIGGTRDLGHEYLREVLDIPVAFIAESSYYYACQASRKFGVVSVNAEGLRKHEELISYHGLAQRCVPGAHVDSATVAHAELLLKDPQRAIDMFTEAARKVIAEGAGVLIPGFGAWSSLFGERSIRNIDGVPIVDCIAVVIKTAEMLVDLKNLGSQRARKKLSKEELIAARKLYGFGQ
jgi:allantoin racemase